MFVRVRSVVVGGPRHEFDIPKQTLDRLPGRYEVVDPKPVAKQRPASHIPGVVEASKPVKRRAAKTGEDFKGRVSGSSDSPSGADTKE